MALRTVTWTLTDQWGQLTAGVVWVTLAPGPAATVTLLNPTTAGLIYDATDFQALQTQVVGFQTLQLDPPVFASLRLDFWASTTAGTDHRLEIGVVPDPSPANYASGALRPWFRNEVSLGIFDLALVAGAAPVAFSITLPGSALTDAMANCLSRSDWDGRMAWSLRAVADRISVMNDPTTNRAIQLQTTQERFFTGLVGGPYGGPHRFVRDQRFGIPALNTQLVRDGETGLWVHPFDWDPEDEDATYRPRPGEGSVDDGLPEG